MRDKKVRLMTEIGVAVALAALLNFITLFRMPQGGKISLEMLPILIVAIRWGGIPGLITGFVYGLLQLILDPYIVHPAQVFLDYPFAYMLVGLAGFIPVKLEKNNMMKAYRNILLAVLLGGFGRFISHLLSGVIFFGQYAPEGQSPWLYSSIYNASYIIPSILVSYLIIIPILKSLLDNNNK